MTEKWPGPAPGVQLIEAGVRLIEVSFKRELTVNLLALHHECRVLIGYVTHYLFCDI